MRGLGVGVGLGARVGAGVQSAMPTPSMAAAHGAVPHGASVGAGTYTINGVGLGADPHPTHSAASNMPTNAVARNVATG